MYSYFFKGWETSLFLPGVYQESASSTTLEVDVYPPSLLPSSTQPRDPRRTWEFLTASDYVAVVTWALRNCWKNKEGVLACLFTVGFL